MSSVGSDRLVVRVPTVLCAEMTDAILHRNHNSREEPWTTSDFVRVAIAEKIAKMKRGRGSRGKGKLLKVSVSERLIAEYGGGG